MSNFRFSRMPNISVPRTKMKQPFTHTTSFNHGKLIPIDCHLVAPGDSESLKLSSIIRMEQLIAPFMDTIECNIHAFFVPLRLIYKNTEEFFGDNKTSAGVNINEYLIPQMCWYSDDKSSSDWAVNTPMKYLGFPCGEGDYSESGDELVWTACSAVHYASALKLRAYYLVWSEWYRAQQLQDPFVMLDTDDTGAEGSAIIGHIGDVAINTSSDADVVYIPLMNVCKKMDYFTAATISPQYGEEVLLPLGDYAPVVWDEKVDLVLGASNSPSGIQNPGLLEVGTDGKVNPEDNQDQISIKSAGAKVDLSKATAASVNQVRYAFQVQKYLERANFGSRYFEVLAAHYGITSPDARLQRPEYLGGQHFYINVNQVVSTAGATTGADTKLGQPGANSTTSHIGHVFSKAFVEWGYVIVMASCRQASHKYSQGIAREDSYKTRFEFYSPEFANLGDQAILNKEIYANGTDQDDEVFGYQEHWAEMRYRPDRVSGMLNPCMKDSEDYWTLANNFASCPVLSAQFIEENRENVKRVLANGDNSDVINDYIADFYFDYTTVRELPAYTIPGLIDHFGSR